MKFKPTRQSTVTSYDGCDSQPGLLNLKHDPLIRGKYFCCGSWHKEAFKAKCELVLASKKPCSRIEFLWSFMWKWSDVDMRKHFRSEAQKILLRVCNCCFASIFFYKRQNTTPVQMNVAHFMCNCLDKSESDNNSFRTRRFLLTFSFVQYWILQVEAFEGDKTVSFSSFSWRIRKCFNSFEHGSSVPVSLKKHVQSHSNWWKVNRSQYWNTKTKTWILPLNLRLATNFQYDWTGHPIDSKYEVFSRYF